MKVQYIGDGTDPKDRFSGPPVIETSGFRFVKNGDPVNVPDDHPRAAKFRGNHTFRVLGEDNDRPEVETDEEAESATLRQELDSRGVKYRPNAKADSLRRLLAQRVEPGPVDDGPPEPPVPAA